MNDVEWQQQQLYDKHGIPICISDVLKVFHYTARLRKKKMYMYKYVLDIVVVPDNKIQLMKISHLGKDITNYYNEQVDGRTLMDYEIVQGHHPVYFKDRIRKT